MSRLLEVADLCSSNVSDPANRLLKRTDSEGSSSAAEKKSSAVPLFRSGHMSAICARPFKGKGGFTRGWKPQVSTLLCPRRVGALPAEVQRKTSRPLGANRLRQFACPAQPVLKKEPPGKNEPRRRFKHPSFPVSEFLSLSAAVPLSLRFFMNSSSHCFSRITKFFYKFAL